MPATTAAPNLLECGTALPGERVARSRSCGRSRSAAPLNHFGRRMPGKPGAVKDALLSKIKARGCWAGGTEWLPRKEHLALFHLEALGPPQPRTGEILFQNRESAEAVRGRNARRCADREIGLCACRASSLAESQFYDGTNS